MKVLQAAPGLRGLDWSLASAAYRTTVDAEARPGNTQPPRELPFLLH